MQNFKREPNKNYTFICWNMPDVLDLVESYEYYVLQGLWQQLRDLSPLYYGKILNPIGTTQA